MRKIILLTLIPLLVYGCSKPPQATETIQEGEPYPGMGPGIRSSMEGRHHASIPAGYSGISNPVEPEGDSIERGSELYATQCASCHGESGLGESRAGVNLDPPASPIAHTSQMLSDDYLFWRISEGGVEFETAMPAWKDILEDEQIWDLVNYVRILGREGSAAVDAFQDEQQEKMLSEALELGLIDREQAESFDLVHAALEDYLVLNSDTAGSMDERESAALEALIKNGSLTAEQVNTFAKVHDLLSAEGLMP
jgi:mono/diheme cytochrome c family protein